MDPGQVELGHVYDRLKHLEDGQIQLQTSLQAVQLKLAEGPRFPAWLPVVMVSILLFLAGQTILGLRWSGNVDATLTAMLAEKADIQDLKGRLTSAFSGMRNNDGTIGTIQGEHLRMRQELDNIQKRTLEGTDDRWRRRDDDARMADLQKYLDSQFGAIQGKVEKLERRAEERDKWWQMLWGTGVLKGKSDGR
jgi:hypothetical protein